ncbi:MAG: hypothetical protein ACI8TP_003468 [Acidimicrobiales bacterium]|jgi:hypothetical protein
MSGTKNVSSLVAGAVALSLGAVGWLGWVRSGSAVKNSYEMFRSAQRLGLDQLTPFRVAWFLVPVVSLAIVVLLVVGVRKAAAGLLAIESLVVGAAALAALVGGVAAGLGPPLGLSTALVGLVAAGFLTRR